MVEHFLEYFVLDKMPEVRLRDGERGEFVIHLNDVYKHLVTQTTKERLDIKGEAFNIVHFMLHAHADLKHHVSYCANRRVVTTVRIVSRIANLLATLNAPDGSGSAIYAGYVDSEYLDKNVNPQRTGFDAIPDGDSDMFGELSWAEIEEGVTNAAKAFLRPHTDHVRLQKENRIREYVEQEAPQYRHILRNHPDRLDVIPADASGDNLEIKLHEIFRGIEADLRREAVQLLEQGVFNSDEAFETKLDQFSRFWDDYNAIGKANLSKYIVHRKLVLEMLASSLKRQKAGNYSREEAIHKIIFPLRKTSDDITYDEHNLWIIDEKLAYHRYLASDTPLNQVQILESNSLSRPDLLAFFDRPIAVVDGDYPYGSGVVIFEFKKPMRDNYTDDDNPIAQVLGYVEDVKTGRKLDKDGRPLSVQPNTPFYCYIVCDLTPNIHKYARQYAGLTTTPDGWGYYGFITMMNAYIEVIHFDKLVNDAHKRNRVLFDKLGLPNTIVAAKNEAETVRR